MPAQTLEKILLSVILRLCLSWPAVLYNKALATRPHRIRNKVSITDDLRRKRTEISVFVRNYLGRFVSLPFVLFPGAVHSCAGYTGMH